MKNNFKAVQKTIDTLETYTQPRVLIHAKICWTMGGVAFSDCWSTIETNKLRLLLIEFKQWLGIIDGRFDEVAIAVRDKRGVLVATLYLADIIEDWKHIKFSNITVEDELVLKRLKIVNSNNTKFDSLPALLKKFNTEMKQKIDSDYSD